MEKKGEKLKKIKERRIEIVRVRADKTQYIVCDFYLTCIFPATSMAQIYSETLQIYSEVCQAF